MLKKQLYQWIGQNRFGEIKQGFLYATHKQNLITQLRRRDLILKKHSRTNLKSLKSYQLTPIFRQMAALLRINVPIIPLCDLLNYENSSQALKHFIYVLKYELNQGTPLSLAFKTHLACIEDFSYHLLALGEKSGTLDQTLDTLAKHYESREKFIKAFKKKITYPLAIFSLSVCMISGVLIFVIPQFEALFHQFNAPLPIATQHLLQISLFLKTKIFTYLQIICSILYILYLFYRRSHSLQEKIQDRLLKQPVIGRLLSNMMVAKFAGTLALCCANELPLIEALANVKHINGFICYTKAIDNIILNLKKGERLQLAMQKTGLFSTQMLQLIKIGESSGQLQLFLNTLETLSKSVVENYLEGILQWIEPILMLFLGGFIGGVLIALYVPLFEMGSVLA